MNIEGLTAGAIVLFALTQVVAIVRDMVKDKGTAQTTAVKENTTATNDLKMAVTKLQVEMQNLKELISMIPKLKQDIDVAHERIRNITQGR